MKKTITYILAILVSIIACICSVSINELTTYAEVQQSTEDLCAEYTQSKVANGMVLNNYVSDFNNKQGVSLGISSDIQAGIYFQNGCTFTYNSDTMINTCTVLSDDNIVKFIPKTLFTYENETFHLGKGYGFYIKTTSQENYYLSNVILIDTMITSAGSDDYAYDVKIMPLAKIDYYYISSQSVGIAPYFNSISQTVSKFVNFYYNLANSDGCVAPALSVSVLDKEALSATTERVFGKGHAADVSDISFGAEVYNVNSYNYGDAGYETNNDYGYFFIGNNYYYSASKYNMSGVREQVNEMSSAVMSVVLGALPNGVGPIYTVVNNTYTVVNAVEQINVNLTYNVTNESYGFDELSLGDTRQTQKEAYGKLVKASAVLLNSPESNTVIFQENDYARAVYNISHTDRSDNVKEYNRIRFNIGLKVGTHSFISEPLEYDINTPETKSVQAFENSTYYMVPGSHAYYTFMPAYSGTYTLNLGRTDLGVKVGGNVLTAENGVYSANLQANTAYTIELTNNTAQITTGSLYIDVETSSLPKTVSPQGSQTGIIKIVPESDSIYSITAGTGGKLIGVKYLNNGLKNVVGAEAIYSGESDCIEVFLHANTAYYILVGNIDATNATSFNVNASSVSRTCTANSSTNLSLVENGNNKYFAIIPSANGVTANITFSQLEGDDMYIFTVLDKNGALYNDFWYLSDGYLGINNLQTSLAPYYIGVRANSNVNTAVKVEYVTPEYEWEIYQGTTKLSWDNTPVVLMQGETYNLKFVIQGEIVVTDLIIVNAGVPESEVSLDPQTGELTIATNARVGRVFTIGALNSEQPGIMFARTLTIIVGVNSD